MRLFYSAFLIICLIACSKVEIETLEGNQPPGETILTTEMKENYVNRVYIILTGRKPDSQEFSVALAQFGDGGLEARQALVQNIFTKKEYHQKLYATARADYLQGVDTAQITRDHQQAAQALQTATGPSKEYWEKVVSKLFDLLTIPRQLDSGLIGTVEMHRRIVDNVYYDDINMGTENFVVATFQNFLFRYPTNVELADASTMVDGFPSSVFLQPGTSKGDFIDIFFESDDYFEGQVVGLYNRYLFRDPVTSEMVAATNAYALDRDYQKLQQSILASDEYFFN